MTSWLFGARMRLKTLANFCRALSTLLHSGVGILKAFDLAADKTSDAQAREILRDVGTELRKGNDISSAMKLHGQYFPELMMQMVHVAEQTGALPEVLAGLADHYENLIRLRKTFITAIAWPMFQLIAAIGVIALLILVLGIIAEMGKGEPLDLLGFGLFGVKGAIIWLAFCFGTAFALFMAYQLLARGFRQQQVIHGLLMRIPVIGYCLQSFAIARFSWALYLTQEAGMPIGPSLDASLRATGNGAFAGIAPEVVAMVKSGDDLSHTLRATELFPEDFLHMVEVGETSGTVPETLHRLSPQFEDQARRSLSALTATLGWLIWLLVAAFIIFVIFRIALWYVGMLNDALGHV